MAPLMSVFTWVLILSIELFCISAFCRESTTSFKFAFNVSTNTPDSHNFQDRESGVSEGKLRSALQENQILEILTRAQELYAKGKYEECLDIARPALELFDNEKDLSNKNYGALLGLLGAALSENGEWELALDFFSKALLVSQRTNDQKQYGPNLFQFWAYIRIPKTKKINA